MNKYLDKIASMRGVFDKPEPTSDTEEEGFERKEGARKKNPPKRTFTKEASAASAAGSFARRVGRVGHGAAELSGGIIGHLTGENVHKAIRQELKVPVQKYPFSNQVTIKARPHEELEKYRKMNDSEILLRIKNSHGEGSEAYQNVRAAMNKKHAARIVAGGIGAYGVAKYTGNKLHEHMLNRQYQQTYGEAPY